MIRLDYKDTDKKLQVEIYGLKFEINSKELEEIDTKNINEENDKLDEIITKVLGKEAIEKINKKRKEDGYSEMDSSVKLTVVMFLVETYVNSAIDPIIKTFDKANRSYDKIMNNSKRIRNNRNRYRRY